MKLNLSPKTKKILTGTAVVLFLVVFAVWMLASPHPEHIEDTNGADNYSLQTITERDVVTQTMGSRGSVSESEIRYDFTGLNISSGKKYSSNKFTGVYRLHTTTLFKGSDIYVDLAEFEIKEGNFAFYIVFDGEVVGKLTPDEFASAEFTVKNVDKTGDLEYVIAGESANFTFILPTGF